MPTLEELQIRKQELEEKLHSGDLSVAAKLEQVDRAIASRTLKVQHSRQRMEVVKRAVAAGMDKDVARRVDNKAVAKAVAEIRAKKTINRF